MECLLQVLGEHFREMSRVQGIVLLIWQNCLLVIYMYSSLNWFWRINQACLNWMKRLWSLSRWIRIALLNKIYNRDWYQYIYIIDWLTKSLEYFPPYISHKWLLYQPQMYSRYHLQVLHFERLNSLIRVSLWKHTPWPVLFNNWCVKIWRKLGRPSGSAERVYIW